MNIVMFKLAYHNTNFNFHAYFESQLPCPALTSWSKPRFRLKSTLTPLEPISITECLLSVGQN